MSEALHAKETLHDATKRVKLNPALNTKIKLRYNLTSCLQVINVAITCVYI